MRDCGGRDSKSAKVVVVKSESSPQKKEPQPPKLRPSKPAAKPRVADWSQVRSNADLRKLKLDELITLMDEHARVEWNELFSSFNTDDEDIHWRAARNILERQWLAVQTARQESKEDYDDI